MFPTQNLHVKETVRLLTPRAQLAPKQKQADNVKSPEAAGVQVADRQPGAHVDFIGRTVALSSVYLRARVTGYLVKVHVKDGADVKQGDVLFEIDPRLYQLEVDKAEAILAQHTSRLRQAEAAHNRAATLHKTNAISLEELNKVAGDIAEAQALMRTARAGRDIARLNLSFTKINAPIAGTLGRRLVDQGNLVKADETVLATLSSRAISRRRSRCSTPSTA